MKQYISNAISYNAYKYLITILDYESNVRTILRGIKFNSDLSNGKVLVDMALKSGLGKYRFVEYSILKDGTIDFSHGRYTNGAELNEFTDTINNYLMKEKEIVKNSSLLESQKKMLIKV